MYIPLVKKKSGESHFLLILNAPFHWDKENSAVLREREKILLPKKCLIPFRS